MSFDELYTELGIDWRPEERSLFVKEIAAAARDHLTTLGTPEKQDPERLALEERKAQLAGELEQETIEFSKVLQVIPLSKADYEAQGLRLPAKIAAQMKLYRFYLVNVPVTMVALPGWGFVELECILEFNPLREAQDRPVAHELLPKDEWETVIRASQGLKVGLSENLEFQTPKLLQPVMGKTGVELAATGSAGLLIGPFEYSISRPKIVARGVGNVKVRWRLIGEKSFQREEPVLGIVLKVPKHLEQVQLIGVLKASGRFHTFTADFRYLKRYLRKSTQSFLDSGAPIVKSEDWDISGYL